MPDNSANQEYNKPGGALFQLRRRKGSLKYFFLDGKLHKTLTVNRGLDTLSAWLFDEYRVVKYPYSAVRKNMGQGFYTQEVAAMLNRHRVTIQKLIMDGALKEPQRTRPMDGRKEMAPVTARTNMYIWSEQDVMDAHAFFSRQFKGRPRKDNADGVTKPLPSRRELVAMMKNQQVFYAQTRDGEFVPVWKAAEW